MKPRIRAPKSQSLLLACLWLALCIDPTLAFDKAVCNRDTTERLQNGSISPFNEIFYRQNGVPMSNISNLVLTLDGCRATCGPGWSFYSDVGPRLTTWLIPILLLIGNMHIARLGPEKYFTMLHILGDPIDTLWSLLTKAEAWSRCYSVARQNIHQEEGEETENYEPRVLDVGTIYAAIEELDGPGTDLFQRRFDEIRSQRRKDMTTAQFYHVCKETANELSDSRSIELLRAGLAIFSYVYHVVAAFVEVVGGKSSSQPGGRIATAMFISWLISVVLISNMIGGFTSRRTCLRIMERFVKTVTGNAIEDTQLFSQDKQSIFFGWKDSPTDFYSAQQWYGALYSYRPRKNLFRGGPRDHGPFLLLFLSVLPLLLSTATSFAILWVTPPVGLVCRHVLVLVIFSFWVISAGITWVSWSERLITGKYHYIITVIKDVLIGIPVFSFIVLSSCGIFNSCFCWSTVLNRPSDAHIFLDDIPEREHNAHTFYPALVAGCLALQFAVFMFMLHLTRDGAALFRRDEKRKQQDWLDTHVHRRHLSVSRSPQSRSVSMSQNSETDALLDLPGRHLSVPNSPQSRSASTGRNSDADALLESQAQVSRFAR